MLYQQKMGNNRIYLVAAFATIFVILVNQSFIQYFLYEKKEDASIINIGGRQRMLSQRLVALTLAEFHHPESVQKEKNLTVYKTWESAHLLLLKKIQPKSFQFYGVYKTEIFNGLQELNPYLEKTKTLLQNIPSLTDSQLLDFISNQDEYLVKMNFIVKQLEQNANDKLNLLIGIEILFAVISLLLIYYEINFVFKKMNQRLARKIEELEDSNLILEQYTYLAAHELRTPTQNISNFTNLLKRKLSSRLGINETKYFEIILDEANRLLYITDDLLIYFSLLRRKANIMGCSPIEILRQVVQEMKGEIDEKNASIEWSNFPKSILADEILLQMIFQQLIANGIKFVPENVEPQIRLNYYIKDSHHVFTVEDNGIGISSENEVKIFGLFKRLHGQESFGGNGIGLSICKKAIEKQRGDISLDSSPRQGSKFVIRLPQVVN